MSERTDAIAVRLPPLSVERATALLAVPEVPAHATSDVALARAAAEGGVPLLLVAEPTARPLLAVRALHAVAHRPGSVWLFPPRAFDGELTVDGTLVFVLDQARVDVPLAIVEAYLDEPPGWIVVVCEDAAQLPVTLQGRLRAVSLRLPALAERQADVPAIASVTLDALAARAGWPRPAIDAEALEALAAHPWPGGRLELEAALSRAFLLAGPDGVIDATLLELSSPAASPVEPAVAAPDAPGPRLEYLLAELAHELRNPLVTVKTFAQQLPALLEDEALRTRFAELTDEAVDRMDALLENVLTFARLKTPRPETLDLGDVLDGVLRELTPALDERDLRVKRIGGGARCAVDREHLHYALSNLLLGIVHETPPRAELVVDASANGTVSLRFGTGAAITRLRDLTAATPGAALDDPTFLPLAFTLARAVLERTGGHLGVVPDLGGQATVTVRLPPAASPMTERGGGIT
jgi:signal transduction histidine kinase